MKNRNCIICLSIIAISSIGLFSCVGETTNPYLVTYITVPNKILSSKDSSLYEICEAEDILKIYTNIKDENIIGYLINNKDEDQNDLKGDIFTSYDSTEKLILNGEEITTPIYKIDDYPDNEYIAIAPSWSLFIYSKVIL